MIDLKTQPASMVHLAGIVITVGTRVIQRCSLCGAALIDAESSLMAELTPKGIKHLSPESVSRWVCGTLVEVDAGSPTRMTHIEPEVEDKLPENTCIYVL